MTLANDPNGISYEAWIESKAGACPRVSSRCDGRAEHEAHWWHDTERTFRWCSGHEWPQPKPPPFAADDEGEA